MRLTRKYLQSLYIYTHGVGFPRGKGMSPISSVIAALIQVSWSRDSGHCSCRTKAFVQTVSIAPVPEKCVLAAAGTVPDD